MSHLAILAYGSLKDNPGAELEPLIRDRTTVQTPFPVEYGRASATRGGAPTLIPMQGGAPVNATLLILAPEVTVQEARDMLWRRELHRTEGRYHPPVTPTPDHVMVDEYKNLGGVEVVLSTRIGANIAALTPENLAQRAIASVCASGVAEGEDGISYLLRAKFSGVETPLTVAYEHAILDQTRTKNLEEAIKVARRSR
jgi:cation transport regulator ChaC